LHAGDIEEMPGAFSCWSCQTLLNASDKIIQMQQDKSQFSHTLAPIIVNNELPNHSSISSYPAGVIYDHILIFVF